MFFKLIAFFLCNKLFQNSVTLVCKPQSTLAVSQEVGDSSVRDSRYLGSLTWAAAGVSILFQKRSCITVVLFYSSEGHPSAIPEKILHSELNNKRQGSDD